MHLRFDNINVVSRADIKLDGLTVIAGENGTGKSTVGKLLFSIVKALSNLGEKKQDYKRKTIAKYIDSLYNRLSSVAVRSENDRFDQEFPLPAVKLVDFFMEIFNDNVLDDGAKVALYREKLDRMRSAIKTIDKITPRESKLVEGDLNNIDICLEQTDNLAADMMMEVRYMIESEFMNRICSFGAGSSYVELSMGMNGTKTELILENDDVTRVKVDSALKDKLEDATYVESPLYIHMLDTLLSSSTFREVSKGRLFKPSAMVPVHIKDLAEKIDATRFVPEENSIDLMVDAGGSFIFKDRTLYYEKDGKQYSPINVASGLKSFGVIQMLLETGAISEKKILIWDEPENHLHPKWQIAFSSVLVGLAKRGIPVLVSTHSPYFVQGIRYFSAKENVEPFVNYYLAQASDDKMLSSTVLDVTDDLNLIFSKLAAPLNDVMNVDMVRNSNA